VLFKENRRTIKNNAIKYNKIDFEKVIDKRVNFYMTFLDKFSACRMTNCKAFDTLSALSFFSDGIFSVISSGSVRPLFPMVLLVT